MKIDLISHENERELHTFRGGIHPEENKWQSTQEEIQIAPLPQQLIVPLQQHTGAPAKPIVEVGQKVLKGELIAKADGLISANIHAPSSGTVHAFVDHAIPHPSGLMAQCILIDTDGDDQWCPLEQHEDYLNLSSDKVLNIVRASGIAGMGGAGFPTSVKLHPRQTQLDTLIINAVECEPYITADDMLMRSYADEVLRGIEVMSRLLEPKHTVIAIEDNKPEACRAIKEAIEERNSHTGSKFELELAVIPTKYPSGGEKQLIYILTGQEVPSGGIPADIGVVCQNVATARSVYRAVRYGEPLISRITTLTGEQFNRPCNVEVLLGTPIAHLQTHFEYTPAKKEQLIIGGPMMGYTIQDAATPVVKTTNCILAPANQELGHDDLAQACIRCGLCTEACPAELLPQQLYWFSRSQEYEKAEHHNLFDCIECGACAYVCPSSIPLVQYYRHAKGEIKAKRLDAEKADKARIRFEARQERLERETTEKEAKRKARAEAAAKMQEEKRKLAEQQANSASPEAAIDPKKAAIEAALARKAQATPTEQTPEPSLEDLQETLAKAQGKLDKMMDALEDAKTNAPDNVAKLQRAVEKNQLRVNQAKQSLEKAEQKAKTQEPAAPVSAAPQVSIEELEVNVSKAQTKLEKMHDALSSARENAPDTVEKLERAVAKNEQRVLAAQNALCEAQAQAQAKPSTTEQSTASLEELQTAVEKAELKLEKMTDALEDAKANAPDNVEKLTRAVSKNQQRVKLAKEAFEKAQSQSGDLS